LWPVKADIHTGEFFLIQAGSPVVLSGLPCKSMITNRPIRIQAMAKSNPFEFIQEVRQETRKVTWPTRKEVGITTLMVFIMVALASVFFFLVDQIIRLGVTSILSLGS
jgi:preprotein translocase subunit SecE